MLQAGLLLVVGLGAVLVALVVAWIRYPTNRARSVAVACFAAYIVVVLAATMFPIAIDSFGGDRTEAYFNAVPLRGILSPTDISREQAIPNIVLGIPFGFGVFFVLRGIRPWKALLAGLGFFALVETVQFCVAVLFPGSPRTIDVNDLILNTMGVAFGILGFVVFADWFTRADHRRSLGSSQWLEYLRSVVGLEQVAATSEVNRDGPDVSHREGE